MQNDRNNNSVKINEDYAPSIVSSDIIFLRNIDGFNFVNTLSKEDKIIIENKINDFVQTLNYDYNSYDFESLTDIDKEIFLEKGLISKKVYNEGKIKFIILKDKNVSIIINSEEHIIIKIVSQELFLSETFKLIESIENKLSSKYQLAASTRYGYLTSNIKNSGLAMKTSVLAYLKGIKSSGKIDETIKLFNQRGYLISPVILNNKENDTDYYKISSKMNFGVTEEQLFDRFKMGIYKLLEINKKQLNKIYIENKDKFNDTIYRSFGILKYASQITYNEALTHLSNIRMGLELDMNLDIKLENLNNLFILIKNAHIKKASNEKNIDENIVRADIIKANLDSKGADNNV